MVHPFVALRSRARPTYRATEAAAGTRAGLLPHAKPGDCGASGDLCPAAVAYA
jgi:hypothetical protein